MDEAGSKARLDERERRTRIVMPQDKDIHAYSAARAAHYDRTYERPERQTDLRDIEAWLGRQMRGKNVLEIACGTGYWTQFIAPVAASITAIDASAETLEIARARLADTDVRFLEDDAYQLRHVGGKFDAIFAGFWFSHVPISKRTAFLDRLAEVSTPAATAVLLDNRFVNGASTPISRVDAEGNTFQKRRLDGSEYEVLENFPAEIELFELGARLGRPPRVMIWRYYWALEFDLSP
jgi:SAM-dependent methyltransferase